MFSPDLSARGSIKAGTVYAIAGENGWIYYGQVTADGAVGFFDRRDRQVVEIEQVLCSPLMSVVVVEYPSIGRAMRTGCWKKLGQSVVVEALLAARPLVQWPVGTLIVTVWEDGHPNRDVRVDDPSIQHLEVMATWDAEYHIPERLTADFGSEPSAWRVGGPIWRERLVKQEMARRSPEMPWHALPEDWVWCVAPLEHPPLLP